jgi:hypothetical protein
MLVKEKLGPTRLGLDLLRASVNVGCSYELTTEKFRAKVSLVNTLVVRRPRAAGSGVAGRARVSSNLRGLASVAWNLGESLIRFSSDPATTAHLASSPSLETSLKIPLLVPA